MITLKTKAVMALCAACAISLVACSQGTSSDNASSTAKAITEFTLSAPAVTGTITESTHTIALTVPSGTDVKTLQPTITQTGASISPASGIAQDFTSPVVYTVTAADSSTQAYTVTVTVAPATITEATIANLTGSWKTTGIGSGSSSGGEEYKKSYTCSVETTTTYKADGTYIEQEKIVCTSKTDTTKTWTDWYYEKGTISTANYVATTIRTNSTYFTGDTVDISTLSWNDYTTTSTTSVVIIDNKLCFDALKRQDIGTGITGTWILLQSGAEGADEPITYSKTEYIFTDASFTINGYENSTGTFTATDTPSYSINYAYKLNSDGTLTYTDPSSSETGTGPLLISGDWLSFGSGATKS